VRILGAVYPAFMLFDIVATGNHFWFDATAGGVTVAAGWWIARALVRERVTTHGVREGTRPGSRVLPA
jgi:hypothetical protein